jgi:hypothetical protein
MPDSRYPDYQHAAKFAGRLEFMVKSFEIGRNAATRGDRSYCYGKVTRRQGETTYTIADLAYRIDDRA